MLTPLELLRKIASIIPPPRKHMVRYHGIFAPNANGRDKLAGAALAAAGASAEPAVIDAPEPGQLERPSRIPRNRRLDWAALLKRTHAVDVLACDHCGGRLRIMAFITESAVVRQILEHLRLPHLPPATAPARDPPRTLLFEGEGWDAANPEPLDATLGYNGDQHNQQ